MTRASLALMQIVAQALPGRPRILLGLSGGLDSCVLLQILQQLAASSALHSLRVLHIHHGLSAQADAWAAFCRQRCEMAGIAYGCIRVAVIQRPRLSLEAAARSARYAAFAQQLAAGEILVTAHHLEDQCETLLLALKRGSGPAGLAAMPPSQPFAAGVLCRPLLSVSRVSLQAYARQQALRWVEDASNQSPQFDRNYLRHTIFPRLIQRWPRCVETMGRSAQLCGEQEQLLDELLYPLLQPLLDQQGALAIAPLAHYSEVKRQALLRRWCRQLGAPIPSRQQLRQLWSQVALSGQAANPQLRLEDWQVRRYRQRLYLLPPFTPLPAFVVWTDIKQPLVLPGGLGQVALHGSSGQPAPTTTAARSGIRLPEPGQQITWRFGLAGRVRIAGRGSRPLKKIYQECGIPPWLRQRLPVLYYDDVAIAIPEVMVTEAGAPQCNFPAALLQYSTVEPPIATIPSH